MLSNRLFFIIWGVLWFFLTFRQLKWFKMWHCIRKLFLKFILTLRLQVSWDWTPEEGKYIIINFMIKLLTGITSFIFVITLIILITIMGWLWHIRNFPQRFWQPHLLIHCKFIWVWLWSISYKFILIIYLSLGAWGGVLESISSLEKSLERNCYLFKFNWTISALMNLFSKSSL